MRKLSSMYLKYKEVDYLSMVGNHRLGLELYYITDIIFKFIITTYTVVIYYINTIIIRTSFEELIL